MRITSTPALSTAVVGFMVFMVKVYQYFLCKHLCSKVCSLAVNADFQKSDQKYMFLVLCPLVLCALKSEVCSKAKVVFQFWKFVKTAYVISACFCKVLQRGTVPQKGSALIFHLCCL